MSTSFPAPPISRWFMAGCDISNGVAPKTDKAAASSPSVNAAPLAPSPAIYSSHLHRWRIAFALALLSLCSRPSLQQTPQQQKQHDFQNHLLLLDPYPSHPMAAADPSYCSSIHHTRILKEIAVDYTPDACHHSPDNDEIRITYDHRGGARWRSRRRFRHGTFGALIRCPAGDTSGLNFNLYLSSLEGDKAQDEIDFEFLGKDKTCVQTNYHVGGAGGREAVHRLGFDASEGFHEYVIRWAEGAIEWAVDGAVVRREERRGGEGWPEKPMYLYASLWDASCIDEGRWTGQYVGTHAPYVCWYRDVRVPAQTAAVEGGEEEGGDDGGEGRD